jgi:hypothetical protein
MKGKREDMLLDSSAKEEERRFGSLGGLWRMGRGRGGGRVSGRGIGLKYRRRGAGHVVERARRESRR